MALALGLVTAGCGSGESSSGTSARGGAGPPSIGVAETWPQQFCRATIGMTHDQMRGLMGEPTSTPDGSDVWEAYGYHFTATFDTGDKVSRLEIDDANLSPEQQSELPCPTTRQ